jgi:hypothetical protein
MLIRLWYSCARLVSLPRRDTGYGEDIDKHYMVMRLDNAPTEGYEKWVGTRTTHRLVQVSPASALNFFCKASVMLFKIRMGML